MASVYSRNQTSFGVSLIDRLTESLPHEVADATLQRGEMPMSRLEDSVYRDLCWLIQTTALDATMDLARWPQVRRSILNYGLPILTGRIIGHSELSHIEASIRKAISLYEPRLVNSSLEVRASQVNGHADHRHIHVEVMGLVREHDQLKLVALQLSIENDTGRLDIKSKG